MIDYNFEVELHPIEDDYHLELMRLARNDPEIRMWCRQVGLISQRDQKKWFERQNDDPTMQMFQITDCECALLGVCGLTSIDHINSRAEFSCYILPEEQGNGYCTKALKTLFSYGFYQLNLNQIWGEVFQGNPALKIFKEKLGMTEDGILRNFYYKNSVYINAHRVSIMRNEWKH